MTDSLSRIRRVRERRLRQAADRVEVYRRALEAAKEALGICDHALSTLDVLSERVAEWLAERVSDPALRLTALARIEALAADRADGFRARQAAAAAVEDAAGELQQALVALARAHARLDAVEALTRTGLAHAVRRREYLAELEQSDRQPTRPFEG